MTNTQNQTQQQTKYPLFSDVVGLIEPKKYAVRRLKNYYEHKEEYDKRHISPSRGMLLYGVPGVGKTFFIKSVYHELIENNQNLLMYDATMNNISGHEVGAVGTKITQYFETIKQQCLSEKKDAVIILDEMDAIAPKRTTHSVLTRERTSELLKALDGIYENNSIFIIGGTNRPWDIDPAILRSGRIEAMFEVPPPDVTMRAMLFSRYTKDIPIEPEVTAELVAKHTEQFSGADFKQLGALLLSNYLDSNKPITKMDLVVAIGSIKQWSNYWLKLKHIQEFSKNNSKQTSINELKL